MEKQKLTNHFIFVLDASGSMLGHTQNVIKVTDQQVEALKKSSRDLGQESRISIYTFYERQVDNVVFDMDVERFKTAKDFYSANGGTPMYDGIGRAYQEAKTISQLHSDHAFLMLVITDGEENTSFNYSAKDINGILQSLPVNWTMSMMVPNSVGKHHLVGLGFPKGNIEIWDVNSATGYEDVGNVTTSSVQNYMVNRAVGVRSTKNLFQTNASNVTFTDVRKAAKVLKPDEYNVIPVGNVLPKTWISDYLTNTTGSYKLGKAFYQLNKPEKIQPQKAVILRNKKTKELFNGPYVRQLINLPDYEVKVAPGDHGDWDIFVQSTSINRHLVPNSELVVLK